MRGASGPAIAFQDWLERPTHTQRASDFGTIDLGREVYCVLGMPIDVTDLAATLDRIEQASANAVPTLISTINLNFLSNSLAHSEFRESLLMSDLCTADGMPIVWLACLLGLPIKNRVAGSDILESLRVSTSSKKVKLFFFGGANGVADLAAQVLNGENGGVTCVGTLNPGYGSIDDMSSDAIITTINASAADLLVVALGAQKGQAWLLRNHHRLRIPIRAHLGAAINFQAGTVKRAPELLRNVGLEWLWRIKEEPYLWDRYWADGRLLWGLLWSRVLPLAFQAGFRLFRRRQELKIRLRQDAESAVLLLSGDAISEYIELAVGHFQLALAIRTPLVLLDFTAVRDIDQRFFGLILMLRKSLRDRGGTLLLTGVSGRVHRLIQLNELEFLLDPY